MPKDKEKNYAVDNGSESTKSKAATAEDKGGQDDSPKKKSKESRISMFLGILLILCSLYLCIVFISYFSHHAADQSAVENHALSYMTQNVGKVHNFGGPFGAYIANNLISGWLGIGSLILVFYMVAIALTLLKVHKFRFWTLTLKCLLLAVTVSMVLGFVSINVNMPSSIYWGGVHGHYVNKFLMDVTGVFGALFVNLIIVSMTILLFYNDIMKWRHKIKRRLEMRKKQQAEARRRDELEDRENAKVKDAERIEALKRKEEERKQDLENKEEMVKPVISPVKTVASTPSAKVDLPSEEKQPSEGDVLPISEQLAGDDVSLKINPVKPIETAEVIKNDVYDPTAELSRFRFPSIELLHDRKVKENSVDLQEQEENKERITKTLNDYGIAISHIEATVGPTVTLYEIIPAEGVRIAKIKRLEDDIALSLAALGIRIIAPIPGRGTIGIEVPNKDPQTVPIRSILSSKVYTENKMELPMAMGSTISNEVFIADLTKMPHLLVAGATGMGKSVGLNTIIASLLYKKHPAELKFVLVDPKMVEFSLYSKLERHYLAKLSGEEEAIITDPKKVVPTLNSLCVEMDNRYNLLKMAGDRNIKDYNHRFTQRRLNPDKGHRYLPYIVVIVDEFADLIMTAGKEVETPIARLAQKARAVGIHLILATQRPSTNVITGIIKANFPGRIAFRVTQMVDSRTILDRPGANQLIGRGDMLFSRDGEITRVQCAFIDTDEVEAICDAIDEQVGFECAYELPEYIPEADGAGGDIAGVGFGDRDPLFDEASRAIVTSGVASTSSLQRRFSIGYNRAGKIMDQMEAAGIVGPSQGGKPRQVLVDIVTLESMLGS